MRIKEDVSTQPIDIENGYLVSQGHDDESYLLGNRQKQMIIDAEKRDPYIFQYYFLRDSSVDADRQVLEGTIKYDWVINFYNGALRIDCGDIAYENVIENQDLLDSLLSTMKIDEDIKPTTVNPEDACHELAEAIASKMGDCEVVDNVVYYLNSDFEIWEDSDTFEDSNWKEVEHGVFLIIEVKSDIIIAYNPKVATCEDIDEIGIKPTDYFTGDIQFVAGSVKEFISQYK